MACQDMNTMCQHPPAGNQGSDDPGAALEVFQKQFVTRGKGWGGVRSVINGKRYLCTEYGTKYSCFPVCRTRAVQVRIRKPEAAEPNLHASSTKGLASGLGGLAAGDQRKGL